MTIFRLHTNDDEDGPSVIYLTSSETSLLGPVACPACGWDDGGTLRVVDWYDEVYPPIPPPRDTLAIWGDDPERDGVCGLLTCPECDDFWDPATMTRRES